MPRTKRRLFSRPARLAPCLLALFSSSLSHAQNQQTISVLAPSGLLDSKIIGEFERTSRVAVRVEMITGRREPEQRLRGALGNWDVVIADENEMAALTYARLLRQLKEEKEPEKKGRPLAVHTRLMDEYRTFAPLMAEPLGVAWLENSYESDGAITWDSLVDPSTNPRWRGRLFLPTDLDFQFRLAMLATGVTNTQSPLATMATPLRWLRRAHQQLYRGDTQLVMNLLSGRCAAGALWKSDYMRIRKMVKNLSFTVPKRGTYFVRFGAGVVNESLHEDLAANFISFLLSRRDELARFAGLMPLGSASDETHDLKSWTLYDNTIPLTREIDTELKRFSLR
jgi:spermidine/putrescine-binding protein